MCINEGDIILCYNPKWIVENSQNTKLLLIMHKTFWWYKKKIKIKVIKVKMKEIIWFTLFYKLLVNNEGNNKKNLIK